MKKIKKRYYVLISVAVLIITFVVVDEYFFPMVNGTVHYSAAYVSQVDVTKEDISFTLWQHTSICPATHIKVREKDGALYVYFKGGIFVSGLANLFEPSVVTIKNKYKEVNEIYVADYSDKLLIWTEAGGMVEKWQPRY